MKTLQRKTRYRLRKKKEGSLSKGVTTSQYIVDHLQDQNRRIIDYGNNLYEKENLKGSGKRTKELSSIGFSKSKDSTIYSMY